MAKRKFKLPGIQDLSKDQEKVRALPKEGQHLIIGGPGTGKSVLALLRARRHDRDGDEYVFLVFNHLLERASGQLFGKDLVSRTWISWFLETFRTLTSSSVPRLDAGNNGFRPIDWERTQEIIEAMPQKENSPFPFLVIDEGQDMPPQFYGALVSLGFERFFVVADQNQQIGDENSSRKQITECLAIDEARVVELRQNFRNSYPVARLAREFRTDDPASPPPSFPVHAKGNVPRLYSYEGHRFSAAARGILRLADRNPRTLIGVIAPKNRVRERYLKALGTVDVRLDNPRANIMTYHAGTRADVAFDEGGILIINAQSCKGLEFDVVVLADIDEHFIRRPDSDHAKRLFYVMVARAREQVFMLLKREGSRDILRILPKDQDVLRREEQ